MIEWKEFDKIMIEAETLNAKNELSDNFIKVLKRAKCWTGNAPYCAWNDFTYNMSERQIKDIVVNSKSMKA